MNFANRKGRFQGIVEVLFMASLMFIMRKLRMRAVFRFGPAVGLLLLCACGSGLPTACDWQTASSTPSSRRLCVPRLQTPSLGIYRAFDLNNRMPTVRISEGGLEILVEEFVSKDKSRELFDAELADYGVLALLVTAVNNSSQHYTIERDTIRAFLSGEPLLRLSAKEAAEQSTGLVYERRGLGQDIAYWIMVLNPAGLAIAPFYMVDCVFERKCSWNQAREQRRYAIEYDREHIPLHFAKLELRQAVLPPGERTQGFVYFKLSGQSAELLDKITLQMTARDQDSGKQTEYKFSLGQMPK